MAGTDTGWLLRLSVARRADVAAGSLRSYRGEKGLPPILHAVEAEWRHLKAIRVAAAQRTSPRPLPAPAAAAAAAAAESGGQRTPEPPGGLRTALRGEGPDEDGEAQATPPPASTPASILRVRGPTPTRQAAGAPSGGSAGPRGLDTPPSGAAGAAGRRGVRFAEELELGPQAAYSAQKPAYGGGRAAERA